MATTNVIVELTTSEPRHGAWCSVCLLSTAIELDILHLLRDGVRLLSTVTYCPECEDWETT